MPLTEYYCTHIWHATEQIWLPHIANVDHTAIMLNGHIDPTCFEHNYQNSTNYNNYFTHITAKYVPETDIPLKCHMYANQFIGRCVTAISVHISHELTATSNVTRSTGIHTFHNIGICPWTNMPVMLHEYVPLHLYCSEHLTQYKCTHQFKHKIMQLLLTTLLPYICHWPNQWKTIPPIFKLLQKSLTTFPLI